MLVGGTQLMEHDLARSPGVCSSGTRNRVHALVAASATSNGRGRHLAFGQIAVRQSTSIMGPMTASASAHGDQLLSDPAAATVAKPALLARVLPP